MTEPPVVWRPRRSRIIAYTLAPLSLLVMAVLAVVMPPPFGAADRVGLLLFGVVVAVLLHLVGRPRVVADAGGLTIVNALRTHRYAWAEVLRVNMNVGEPWPTLDLADGSSVGAMGIQGAERERAAVAVAQLREMIAKYGEAV